MPVVVGSQFPLTEAGSQIYARTFYRALLADHKDVRVALANARSALTLAKAEETGHDWASIAAHLRLPEGYSDQIAGAALRVGLAQLHTTSRWAQRIVEGGEDVSQRVRDDIDARFAERLAYLESWLEDVRHDSAAVLECMGLIASAYKRWAELEFGAKKPGSRERSRELLARAGSGTSRPTIGAVASLDRNAAPGREGRPDRRASRRTHRPLARLVSRGPAGCRGRVHQGRRTRQSVIWSLGSIAELCLLAPLLQVKSGPVPTVADAQQALERMVKLADGSASLKGELDSAWRQWRRYVRWWTTGNGSSSRPEGTYRPPPNNSSPSCRRRAVDPGVARAWTGQAGLRPLRPDRPCSHSSSRPSCHRMLTPRLNLSLGRANNPCTWSGLNSPRSRAAWLVSASCTWSSSGPSRCRMPGTGK